MPAAGVETESGCFMGRTLVVHLGPVAGSTSLRHMLSSLLASLVLREIHVPATARAGRGDPAA